MKPLATNQRWLIWFCMCSAAESTSKKRQLFYVLFTFVMSAFILAGLVSSILFFVKFISVDFKSCLYAVFQIAASVAVINLMIVGLMNRNQIANIFTKLSDIYAAS